MNQYIESQITNMVVMAKTFCQSCKMASTKDDGIIDRQEEKVLKKINAATERYIKELQSLK